MNVTHVGLVHYIPIATTVLSALFGSIILRRYLAARTGPHLMWWAAGIVCYGLGTGLESAITLWGNSVALNKAWYIAGALLGGYPLAQGTVFLLLSRRKAMALTAATLPIIVILAALVALSPVHHDQMQMHRPGGAMLAWQWVRWFTPLVNLYAAVFLIGGAILSAIRYSRRRDHLHRAIGNALIAFGAILPGIGGSFAKAGLVEMLYIGEFIGLLFIWAGYAACTQRWHSPTGEEFSASCCVNAPACSTSLR